jgi:alpha-D-ribose 1-methylphosphonate 5-triphosphate synthase subunit PhnL
MLGVSKSFVMHLRGGIRMDAVGEVSLSVSPGECLVLSGPSGAGKSSVLKMVYGNYSTERGRILVNTGVERVDVAAADPRQILVLRRSTIAYVSQFLRVVPRVPARDVVAEALIAQGALREAARHSAEILLDRLNVPVRLWDLPPATFSGGEQQRVNVARGFITHHPLLLLDEPSASLDAENKQVVVELVREKKAAGVAILGIFHDADVREAVADRTVEFGRIERRAA